ncbi:MAG: peptidyl-prolyl cis-trans isomerase [Candidatus Cloacimonadota bacterium]|nr:peptidyl-prolyl cis-trans isomerase [Candidatus Cloacimonadota bacterium]
MKYIFAIILIICSSFVSAKIIAEVGVYKITSSELQKEMENYEGRQQYSYSTIRQLSLTNLIDKYLIKNYALEERIYIDDSELEAFFIHQVGDLPRFQTNGTYDRREFLNFKNSISGSKVINAMKDEILITKTKTILKKSFDVSDDKLLKQYFIENTKIDLGYAIIDKQDVDFEIETSPEEFEWYYKHHKYKYNKEEKIKLNIFIVLNEDFKETVKPIVSRKITAMILADSTINAEDTAELRKELTKEEIQKLTRQKALQLTELLQAKANIAQTIIETSYLSQNDKLGELPEIILNSAFELDEGQFSEPISIEKGYLVFKVIDKKKITRKDDQTVAKAIWLDYITEEINKTNDAVQRQYFEENFEKFIIPAVVVTKVEISNPSFFSSTSKEEYQQELKYLLERNADDEYQITRIVNRFNLSESKEIVYLEKFDNSSIVDDMIAIRMSRGETWGFIPIEKKYFFYKALSFFPEFIPSYKKISAQLPEFIAYSKEDSTKFNDYFDSHKRDFRTPDSLQIGGVVFTAQNEFNRLEQTISDNELKKTYDKRMNEFYRERSVKFNYIFLRDFELAEIISEQAAEGIDVSLLEMIFGCTNSLPKNEIIPYDDLPKQISLSLSKINSGTWSQPISYDNGWIVLHKIQGYNAGIISFAEIKTELRKEALFSIADSMAFNKAKVVFDSTRYFAHLLEYVEEPEIFITEFQDAKDDFYILGDISNYRTELLRMWNNEKYSGIIRLDDAYAVIFQLKINRSHQLIYEEALPQIIEIHNSKIKFEFAKANVSEIKDKIASGTDPDSLLYYLGGWNVISGLSLTSKIPGVDFSEAIFDDILKHQEGYCSSVIPINSEKLLFYKLLRLNKPSKNDFYSDRKYYEKRFLQREFEKWKNKYKVKIGVKMK